MVKSGLEKNIFEISPCVKPFLGLKRSFLDKREDLCPELQIQSQNWPCLHMEGFQKNLFVVYLYMVNETLSQKLHPYSILSSLTKYESVAY